MTWGWMGHNGQPTGPPMNCRSRWRSHGYDNFFAKWGWVWKGLTMLRVSPQVSGTLIFPQSALASLVPRREGIDHIRMMLANRDLGHVAVVFQIWAIMRKRNFFKLHTFLYARRISDRLSVIFKPKYFHTMLNFLANKLMKILCSQSYECNIWNFELYNRWR